MSRISFDVSPTELIMFYKQTYSRYVCKNYQVLIQKYERSTCCVTCGYKEYLSFFFLQSKLRRRPNRFNIRIKEHPRECKRKRTEKFAVVEHRILNADHYWNFQISSTVLAKVNRYDERIYASRLNFSQINFCPNKTGDLSVEN